MTFSILIPVRLYLRAISAPYSPQTYDSKGDVEALSSGAKYIKTLIPAIVNIVYKKLLETDITARAFHTRTTADETPIEEFIGENSPQILHRKMFLRMYLLKLCSDPTQMEFWRYLDKVGYLFPCGLLFMEQFLLTFPY